MSEKDLDAIEKSFNLPLVQTTIATIDLVGLVSVGNSNGILVPYTIYNEEFEALKASSEVPVEIIDSKLT
ncbi:MAG: hypothetical protein ACTSQZ_08415, partial [Candidatus Thorarchaeota archaeon]